MRNTTLLLLITGVTVSNAQPVIDQNSFGTTTGVSYQLTTSDALPFGPSGANVVWDYTQLNSLSTDALAFVDPVGSGLESLFPNATVLSVNQTTGIVLAREVAASGGSGLGAYRTSDGLALVLDDPGLELMFPSTYLTSWTDAFSGNYIFDGNIVGFRSGAVQGLMDGYGELQMPFGTVTDVLRLKLTETYTETLGANTSSATGDFYYYYKLGNPYAIVRHANGTVTTNGVTTADNSIRWVNDANIGMNTEGQAGIGSAASPNPCSGSTMISFAGQGDVTLTLIDVAGRTLRSVTRTGLPNGLHQQRIDTQGLPAGAYSVRIVNNLGEAGNVRLVVE